MQSMLDSRRGGDTGLRRILREDDFDNGFDHARLSWPVGILKIVGVEEVARESECWCGGICSWSYYSSFLSHV